MTPLITGGPHLPSTLPSTPAQVPSGPVRGQPAESDKTGTATQLAKGPADGVDTNGTTDATSNAKGPHASAELRAGGAYRTRSKSAEAQANLKSLVHSGKIHHTGVTRRFFNLLTRMKTAGAARSSGRAGANTASAASGTDDEPDWESIALILQQELQSHSAGAQQSGDDDDDGESGGSQSGRQGFMQQQFLEEVLQQVAEAREANCGVDLSEAETTPLAELAEQTGLSTNELKEATRAYESSPLEDTAAVNPANTKALRRIAFLLACIDLLPDLCAMPQLVEAVRSDFHGFVASGGLKSPHLDASATLSGKAFKELLVASFRANFQELLKGLEGEWPMLIPPYHLAKDANNRLIWTDTQADDFITWLFAPPDAPATLEDDFRSLAQPHV